MGAPSAHQETVARGLRSINAQIKTLMRLFSYATVGNWPWWMMRCHAINDWWEIFWSSRRYDFLRN